MSEHSPTPWRLHPHAFASVISGPDRQVANCGGYQSSHDTGRHITENTANAAFIVRAANNFDELMKVLEGSSHAFRSYQHGNASKELAEALANAIDAALAKARGEQE